MRMSKNIYDCILERDVGGFQQCLEKRTDVNDTIMGMDGKTIIWTPLHFAVHYDVRYIALLLIEKGADVNAEVRDSFGFVTPLHRAIAMSRYYIIKELINHGAHVMIDNHKYKLVKEE